MSCLDNFLANLWEKMARSKYSYDICPKMTEIMLWRARRGFPQNTHFKIVMDTNIWRWGDDVFTSLRTASSDKKCVEPFGGWLLVRAQRYLENEEDRIQTDYFAPIRSLILDKECLSVFLLPGIDTEFHYRRRGESVFGLDMWEGVVPNRLNFSMDRTLQSYLLSLGNKRPKSAKDLPEFERLWFAYEGYSRTNVTSKELLREKLFERIYQERWDDRYNRLVDALADGGKAKKQTQDAWHLRMLELKEFGIDYFLTMDKKLIRKVRNMKYEIFDKVKDKVVTPREFCKKYGVGPVPIRYLAFSRARSPVALDTLVKIVKEK